ncbi:transcriptional regulator [Thiovibrio sp. JS02]
MSQTARQMILNLLSAQGPLSAKEISGLIRIGEKEVYAHLAHIRRSLQHGRERLTVIPARCRDCGFKFIKRQRLVKPGHCPRCKGTYIEEPLFRVE